MQVNRIFLLYDRPWWEQDSGSDPVRLAWSDRDIELKSLAEWYKSIDGFATVPGNSHVLTASVGGDSALLLETKENREVGVICTQLIRQFTGNPLVPLPVKVLKTAWCSNALSYGSHLTLP